MNNNYNELMAKVDNSNEISALLIAASSKLNQNLQQLEQKVDDMKLQMKQEITAQFYESKNSIKTEIKDEIDENIKAEVRNQISGKGLTQNEYDELEKLRKNKIKSVLGYNPKSVEYRLYSPRYFAYLGTAVKNHFDVSNYKNIPSDKYEEVVYFIKAFNFTENAKRKFDEELHQEYQNDLMPPTKKKLYESHFHIDKKCNDD